MSEWPFDHSSCFNSATLKIVFMATGIFALTLFHTSPILVEFYVPVSDVVTRCMCPQSQLGFASRRETGWIAPPELHWTTYAQGVEQVVSNIRAGIYESVVTRSGSMNTVRTSHADEKVRSPRFWRLCVYGSTWNLQPSTSSPLSSF